MFGFFKKSKPDSSEAGLGKGGPVICALLMEGTSFPVDAFLKQVAKTKLAGKAVSETDAGEGGAFSFKLGDEIVAMALVRAPYPAPDLEGPMATSLMWPPEPPIDSLRRHRSHLLITMMGGGKDPVQRRLAFTAVTALAAKQPGVMAVYWCESTQVIFPPVFIEMAETINSPEAPPLYIWVDLRVFKNEDGTTGLFTTGLVPLGHKEIEIPSIEMDPGELREWTFNIIFYLLENGPVLKDGQTIGMTAEQQIRIRHCASSFGHDGTVIRLDP